MSAPDSTPQAEAQPEYDTSNTARGAGATLDSSKTVMDLYAYVPPHALLDEPIPGFRYALVADTNQGQFQTGEHPLAEGLSWNTLRDPFPTLRFKGPDGETFAQLVAEGERIIGASPHNGVRLMYIDPEIEARTGLRRPPMYRFPSEPDDAPAAPKGPPMPKVSA